MQKCVPKSWEYLAGLLLILSSARVAGGLYQLTVPSTHAAFSGDLEIGYSVPQNVSMSSAFVTILFTEEGQKEHEITSLHIPPGTHTGKLILTCGVLEYPGTYTLQMYMFVGSRLLTQTTFIVEWPRIQLFLPDRRRFALTENVPLRIQSRATCEPIIHRESFFIELYFKRPASAINILPMESSKIKQTFNYTHLSKRTQTIEYQCDLFDLDGSYQAVLKSTFNSGTVVTRSNVFNVSWSQSYSVNIRKKSIFPCKGAITVLYIQPACARPEKHLQDRIRMYELRTTTNGSLAAPLKQKYIIEKHANPNRNSFELSCRLFNKTAAGFCFKYVSISRSGAVHLQRQQCLAAHPNSVFYIDGGWSEWTEWSLCTVTCGSGKRNRFRICNNPAPLHGGKFCEGDPVQWKPCNMNCPGYLPNGPLKSPKFDMRCACGCGMSSNSGEIIASGRCSGRALWTIEAEDSHRIRLTFTHFNILESKQWVKVRDGETPLSDILYSSINGEQPHNDISSSSNKMSVELMTFASDEAPRSIAIFPINATEVIHLHGFIASYRVVAGGGTRTSTIIRREKSSILDSKVAVVGIALCVLIVLVVITFVLFHRLYHKRHKYAMAASESPLHIARSTSMHSSRCSSPPPGLTNVDVEAPLTGEATKKDNMLSRGSSISSTCSAGLKKLRSKAESVTGSPKPSTKTYSPLPSPYTAHSPPEEFLHNSNFFKASPNLRNCRPRSPKIHPSPKFKHSPGAATPCSPSKTKHELLTKKRKEQLTTESERIVTGSSGSSKDAPVATPETPTPVVNKGMAPVKASLAVARTPGGDRTPQNEVIILESLREEHSRLNGDEKYPDANNETTSFIQSSVKARRPTSLTESYSTESIGAKPKLRTAKQSHEDKKKPSAMEERQKLLPKPDGQSPKSPTREEHSKSSTPRSTKSSRSSKSAKTMSPTRSINTPSEIGSVDIELEYDDFIEDDPLSYFEVSELQKLRWQGGEKIGKPVKD
ncbi:uncharacterized protein [Haliotis asinina]|uniref:uncharacterized protein isoform X1 n=1 Tax=Haliotis asinina TaxID=109174 RepID=UPI003531E9B5